MLPWPPIPLTTPVIAGSNDASDPTRFDIEMNNAARSSRAQTLTLIAAFLGWMFDGLEQGIFPLVARPALQDLLKMSRETGINESVIGDWTGWINAAFLLGAAAGGLAFG